MPRVASLAIVVALAGATGCKREPTPAPPPPLAVEVSGCRAVRRGPVCELPDDRELRVIVGVAGGVSLAIDGAPIVPASVDRLDDGGSRLHVRLPGGARALRVATAQAATTIAVDDLPPPEWFTRARDARRAGATDDALAAARGRFDAGGYDEALARGLEARIAMGRGDDAAAIDGLRASVRLHRDAGRLSDAADDALALAFVLTERAHDYAGARAVLDLLERDVAALPDARAALPYYESRLARAVGDVRTELELVAEAERRAARLGLAIELREAQAARAMASHDLGRYDESCRIYRELLASGGDDYPCAATRRRVNLAIAATGAIEIGAPPGSCPADPVKVLDEALGVSATCGETAAVANAWIGLADAHATAGRLTEAKDAIAKARALTPDPMPDLAMNLAFVQGEIALAERDFATASRSFRASEEAASLAGHEAYAIRAAVAAAGVPLARGDVDGALRAWARADARLDDATLRIPLGEGRASFAGAVQRAAGPRMRTLVARGRAGDALAAIVGARTRTIQDLAAPAAVAGLRGDPRARWDAAAGRYGATRADLERGIARAWTLPERERGARLVELEREQAAARVDLERALVELSPLAKRRDPFDAATLDDGVVLLAYEPVGDGYALVVASRGGSIAKLVPPDALLGAADDAIARARRIRVLVPPELASADLHALLWHGAPLVARAPVEYVLAGPLAAPAPSPAGGAALVVADPNGDLPGARAEARAVQEALAARGAPVTLLLQTDATSARTLGALGAADTLHFAGHALHEPDRAWAAALALHRTDRLEIADVLAAPRVPSVVVLAACDGAKVEGDALGIAHAFVLAGARAVVAPSRPVDDAFSLAFARRFYAAWDGDAAHVAGAVRAAQLDLRDAGDWAAFRVFVP